MSGARSGRRGTAETVLRAVGTLGLVGFAVMAFTPAANVLSRLMTLRVPVDRAAAIVVLGGGGVGGDGTLTDTSLRRLAKGLELYRRGVAPLLVISGAKTAAGDEALARSEFARACGVAASAIITESAALTTRDEAIRLGRRLLPRGIRTIALVVDAEGTRRAAAVFRRQGFVVLPVPVTGEGEDSQPEGRLAVLRRVMLETTALMYYRAAGYL